MEYVYCQRCGKELHPGTDHYRYCAGCLNEFFGDVAYLDEYVATRAKSEDEAILANIDKHEYDDIPF